MTKKDYELIADALRSTDPRCGNPTPETKGEINQWKKAIYKLAFALKNDNSQFDMDKFAAACGL